MTIQVDHTKPIHKFISNLTLQTKINSLNKLLLNDDLDRSTIKFAITGLIMSHERGELYEELQAWKDDLPFDPDFDIEEEFKTRQAITKALHPTTNKG